MVELLLEAVTLLLLLGLVAGPVWLCVRFPDFPSGFTWSFVAVVGLTILLSWWRDYALDLELLAMGVDLDDFTTDERMRDVAPHLQDRAERMAFSPERLGVGWPIKAGFALFVSVPYAMAVCCITWLVRRVRRRGRRAD
ncbi:hypothetical protein SAMN05444279_13611 [Ruegeria intermedia]|uniref:Uncharacterized protein n=1 Tax=Ruegeria intermedia TaxID=996115 RepID=A0A1M5BAZ5_9RHOB|nr:hypothetical protein [Ruegeria intermedia]SHF39741.1 hypothetical protein SAMN05444279_13611 [Ruegeria intermedia]